MKVFKNFILKKIEEKITIFSLSASIFVSVLLAETIILALINQFKAPFVYFSLIPALTLAIFYSRFIKRDIKLLPGVTMPAVFLIFLVSLILIFYPHDTFGGRDEAAYLNSGVHLSNNSSLKFPQYLDNLPDNSVEKNETRPPAYPVWIATQGIFFGKKGLFRNNVILIILGLSSLFLTSSYLGGKTAGFVTISLFASSMPFLWFSRETMSENLSFFLLWTLILFLLLCLKTKRLHFLSVVFICSWLFASTRLEGFLLQFVLLLVLPFSLFFLKITNLKKNFIIMSIFLLVVTTNVLISRTTFAPFLKKVVPTVTYSLKRDLTSFLPKKIPQTLNKSAVSIKRKKTTNLYDKMLIFFAQMLAKYNLFLPIFSIFLVAGQFLIRVKKLSRKKIYFLIIFIILLPEFYKSISPGVTIDEPWLYRRYMYALLPFGYIGFYILLKQFINKRSLLLVFSGLLVINILLSSKIIFLKNNWGLIDKMYEITKDISQDDFVIIRNWTLGYYYPGSFLILQRGIRGAFNSTLNSSQFYPETKVFNGIPYNRIFLLSTKDENNYPFFKITKKRSVDIEYAQLIPSCQLKLLEKEERLNPANIGILSFSSVQKYCGRAIIEIKNIKEQLNLYELNYEGE